MYVSCYIIMDSSTLKSRLEEGGELMVVVGNFSKSLEIHHHDTEIHEETAVLGLSDEELEFEVNEIMGVWKHQHRLEELGLGE